MKGLCKVCGKPVKIFLNRDGHVHHPAKSCGNRKCIFTLRSQSGKLGNGLAKKEKTCKHCKKPFKQDSARQVWCKLCVPDCKQRRMMQKYNLSRRCFLKLLKQQKGVCKICKKPFEVVDHCHKTGKVRGLLCIRCNVIIGFLEMDLVFLKKAVEYIGKTDAIQIKSSNALDVRQPSRNGKKVGQAYGKRKVTSRKKEGRKDSRG